MQKIEFVKSAVTHPWDSNCDNLLEFAEQHGLDLDYGCRQGNCTACQQKIVEGEITYPDGHSGIPEDNYALLCCCVPNSEKVVIEA